MSLFPRYTPAKPAKPAKPSPTLATLATLAAHDTSNIVPVAPLPPWQTDLCTAHGDLNNWRGRCPCSLDDCLISKILDSDGDIDKLRGLEIGHGITSDQIIDNWIEAGEPLEALEKNLTWLICMAEHLLKGQQND